VPKLVLGTTNSREQSLEKASKRAGVNCEPEGGGRLRAD